MENEPDVECPFCGDVHLVEESTTVALGMSMVPTVRGSRMRHGGPFTTDSGLAIGTDEWRKVRCMFCGAESMTPLEMVFPHAVQFPDGAYAGHCSSCDFDLRSGFEPGHNPNRARRRR